MAALACVGSALAIDFTPQPHRTAIEGGYLQQVAFASGSERALYIPPEGWATAGTADAFTMKPPTPLADASIRSRAKLAPALDRLTAAHWEQEMRAHLPREATEIKAEPMEANPLLFDQRETRRLTLAYTLLGQHFRRTEILCYYSREAICFQLTARSADFEALYEQLRRSLYSWEGLK